ncbi:MAG: polyisoprenoid-binding protein YceI [Polaribacter sp.]|mgnify:CR=1 FL=1|jgi:polyisoprenoid-binding protein YceI
MKKIILVLVVLTTVFVSWKGKENKKTVVTDEVKVVQIGVDSNVNISESVVLWKGFKPTGSHNGTVKLVSGTMTIENGVIAAGEFVMDMNSITDADGSTRLEGHLKNADFFDVEKYPTSKFVVTSSELEDGKVQVTGDLTIKDVTKSITISAIITEVEGAITFKSETFELNRADFNVKYGSKSFFANLKDKFINDNMEISFEVKGTK